MRSISGLRNFRGRNVHVVQIGLGTNSTFIQNYANWYEDGDFGIDWLLESISEKSFRRLHGIAVEPVLEHIDALRPMVDQWLPNVALVQCAIGDADGESQLYLLPKDRHDELLRQAPWWQRKDLEKSLSYLLNMSCVGYEHPGLKRCLKQLWDWYGVELDLHQTRVGIWSWEKLACELNFSGCELLVVDTEGFDVRILKSMVAYCLKLERDKKEDVWPHVIQFETQGHCDQLEGEGAEWGIIDELQKVGYTLIHYSFSDTQLARTHELWYNERVMHWARTLVCERCGVQDGYPYFSCSSWEIYCQVCNKNSR